MEQTWTWSVVGMQVLSGGSGGQHLRALDVAKGLWMSQGEHQRCCARAVNDSMHGSRLCRECVLF